MPAVMAEWARRPGEPAAMADIATRLRELGSGGSAVWAPAARQRLIRSCGRG